MAAVEREDHRQRQVVFACGMSSSSRYQSRPKVLAVRFGKRRRAALAACSSTRRRRRRVTDSDAAVTGDASSSWASLPEDLVDLIAWRVLAVDLLDYVRFRAVCPHWRSSTASPRGRGIVDRRFHPRRWMMLPEGHGLYPGHGKLRGFVRFFNLSTGAFVRVHLPLFRDHCVLDSIDGLLLLQRDHDTAARLLNPFTGDILDFPPLETLLPYVGSQTSQGRWFYIRHVNATSMNVSADGVVSLMIFGGSCWSKIVFATSREQRWRVSSYFVDQYSSPLSFQGKIYVLRSTDCYAKPEILEIGPPQLLQGKEELWMPPPRSIAKCPLPCSSDKTGINYPYLAECGTEMMVVSMTNNFNKLLVHRVADLMLGRAVPVTRIGGNCLFIDRRKLYVSSKAFPTIVDDTIVFYSMQKRMLAQYHLSSGTILPATNIPNAEDAGPSPCSIISHIYTCCYREKWNKGQIAFRGGNNRWRVKGKWRTGA